MKLEDVRRLKASELRTYEERKFARLLEHRLVTWVRGDFARGQRTRPIAPENAIIPVGSFGDVDRQTSIAQEAEYLFTKVDRRMARNDRGCPSWAREKGWCGPR